LYVRLEQRLVPIDARLRRLVEACISDKATEVV
jgi:hypothetical protein